MMAKLLGLSVFAASKGLGAYGGAQVITGAITENGVPVARYVRLYDRNSGALVRVTRSHANGQYGFSKLKSGNEWFVVSHDTENRAYNAVIQDMIRT